MDCQDRAQAGVFIVPDRLCRGFLPLMSELPLVSAAVRTTTETNLAQFNRATRAGSQDYFFARDFARCPFSLP